MKWDGDKYKEMKLEILETLRKSLHDEHASKITLRQVCNVIDEMVDKLIGKDKK